jgi:hypothetical protein
MIPKGSSMSRFRQGELTKVRNYNYSFVKSNLRNETLYRTPEFITPSSSSPTIPATVETESKSDDLQLLAPPPSHLLGKSSNRILECIALNTTTKEIVNGRFETFMNRLLERTVATDTTRSITLYIILNNSQYRLQFSFFFFNWVCSTSMHQSWMLLLFFKPLIVDNKGTLIDKTFKIIKVH